jgi:hypothetical protein
MIGLKFKNLNMLLAIHFELQFWHLVIAQDDQIDPIPFIVFLNSSIFHAIKASEPQGA